MYFHSLPGLASLSSFFLLSSAFTVPQPRSNGPPLPSHLVHQFPNPTWIENIAVRCTGQLILTTATTPDVYYVNPASPAKATLIHHFSQNLAAMGITELKPDHFYVLAGNFSLAPLSLGLNTNSVYSIDLSSYHPSSNTGAVVKKVADVPKIRFGNGLTTLDASKNLVIIADSIAGAVWVLNIQTGEYRILLQEPEMIPPPSSGPPIGINGVRVLPSSSSSGNVYIYFDNTNAHLFCRIPLSLSTLQKTGPVQVLANLTSQGLTTDDFALDQAEGVAYVAGQQNQILQIPLEGGPAVDVLGGLDQTVVAGPTSVALARGQGSEGTIYVTTNGGLLSPVNGTYTEGGKVLAVDTKVLWIDSF
jgi:hypothetical protein